MKHLNRRFLLVLASLIVLAVPARAYEDYLFNFSIKGPKGWLAMPTASVPGTYRFGWTSPEWGMPKARNVWGSTISVFVQDTEGHTAQDLLEKNVAVISGKTEVKPDPRANLRVVKQQTITVDGNPGFVMEVLGNGTGFAISVPVDPKAKNPFKMVPTRQRWFCVVKGKNLIGVLSTCPDSLYKKYAPTFTATEKTLQVR
ncbi:MAG: hypothetical protein EB084_00750 [Proteobacteria bacterium]|nr:hypothetical protein [Pseudomonadota bacterium]